MNKLDILVIMAFIALAAFCVSLCMTVWGWYLSMQNVFHMQKIMIEMIKNGTWCGL